MPDTHAPWRHVRHDADLRILRGNLLYEEVAVAEGVAGENERFDGEGVGSHICRSSFSSVFGLM
jgi:hypothetical protein